MAKINLSALQQQADEKNPTFVVELEGGDVTLLPYLRLTEDQRAELNVRQARVDAAGESEDVAVYFRDMIRIVAESPDAADRLLEAIGDSAHVLAETLSEYARVTRQGEAVPSQS